MALLLLLFFSLLHVSLLPPSCHRGAVCQSWALLSHPFATPEEGACMYLEWHFELSPWLLIGWLLAGLSLRALVTQHFLLCPSLLCHSLLCHSLLCHSLLCHSLLCHSLLCHSCVTLAYWLGEAWRSMTAKLTANHLITRKVVLILIKSLRSKECLVEFIFSDEI